MRTFDKTADVRGRTLLDAINIGIEIYRDAAQDCPPWSSGKKTACACGGIHGAKYQVRLYRFNPDDRWLDHMRKYKATSTYACDFWNSHADANHETPSGTRTPIKPNAFDILECLVSDASMPDHADDVASELGGDMPPSQCQAIAEQAHKLQRFFTWSELQSLHKSIDEENEK